MLEQRVSIFKNKIDNGSNRTTIVVDNMSEKTLQTIMTGLYNIGVNIQQMQDVKGYVTTAPSKSEAKAMEEAATDTSSMDMYASTNPEEEAELMAEGFFNENYGNSGSQANYLKAVVNTCYQASRENNPILVKAMYMAADRLLQGNFTEENSNELRNYLLYCSYMELFRNTFRVVAEQKGVMFNDSDPNAYMDCIKYLLQNMTLEEMQAVVASVESKY